MKRGFLSEAYPSTQLLFAGLILVGSWIVFQLLGMVSGMFLFGLSFNEIINAFQTFTDPLMIGFLKYVQAFTSTGMFIFSAIAVAFYIDTDWKLFLGLKEKPGWMVILLAIVFIIIILPFTNLLTYYNANLHLPQFLSGVETFFRDKEIQMTEIMESLLKPGGMGGIFVNLLVIAVIPAIGEELTFRGIIQKLLNRWFGHPHWAILVTAVLFSAIHIQFLSFLPRFFLGLVLGYLFYWSGSIWLTMLVHFINNAIAVIFYHYYYSGAVGNYMEIMGTPEKDLALSLIGVLAGSLVLYLICRKYMAKNNFN
jgi:membrane protease YdiL (CAAX protease family)